MLFYTSWLEFFNQTFSSCLIETAFASLPNDLFNVISEWVFRPDLTDLSAAFSTAFLGLLSFTFSYPSSSKPFGQPCLSIFSPSYFCSLLEKYEETFLCEHDVTWIVSCIWSEWRSIHFGLVVVVVEVPLRIYCNLLFH